MSNKLSRAGKTSVPSRPVRIFSEARLHLSVDGTINAIDPSSGGASWDAYVDQLGVVELAARVGPADATATVPLGRIAVRPLPFYSGPRQLIRRLPSVLRSVIAATAGASICIFRLPGTIGLLGGTWCRVRGRPYVVEIVGDPAGVLRSGVLGTGGRYLASVVAGLMRWVAGGAAAGRYVTEGALQRLYPLAPGTPAHYYANVRLADDDFTTTPRGNRSIHRIIAVGSQDQLYKGHDDLIRAVALLADRGIHVDVSLVGDGRCNSTLRGLAQAVGISDRVTFHGRVTDRKELRRMLDEADLFCMPSRTEGLPRALIEAMARGVPAIGTDVGGIGELLDCQFLVPPNDPGALAALIAALVQGTIDPKAASKAVWERARRFGSEQQSERVRGWLNDVKALARASSYDKRQLRTAG